MKSTQEKTVTVELNPITYSDASEISQRAIDTLKMATSEPEEFKAELREVIGVVNTVVNAKHKAGIVKYTLSIAIGAMRFSFAPLAESPRIRGGLPKNPGSNYQKARPVDAVALLFILRCLAGLNPSIDTFAQLAFVSAPEFATRVSELCNWLTTKSKGVEVGHDLGGITLTCRTMEYSQTYKVLVGPEKAAPETEQAA